MTEQSKCNQRTGRHETQHILGKLGHVDHVASVLSVSMNIHKYNIYMEQLNGGKNHIVRTVPKCHKNRRNRQNRYLDTQIHDCSLSRLDTGTSIKGVEID